VARGGTPLRGAAALIAAMIFFAWPAGAQEAPAPLTADWLARARIAGADLPRNMTAAQIESGLAALAAQDVSVVEADSDLSRFLTDAEFEAELDLMRRYTAAAHRLGLKVVWYYPTLEVLSPNAGRGRPTMYQAHPTWVQRGLDGKPNVFYGGKGSRAKVQVHWVKQGTESAWMSLHSPYADLFVGRVQKIAATGVDGIWLDVPLYSELGAVWPDAGDAAAAKFKADSGMPVPKRVDWADPVWRRWIAWRYGEISSFLLRVKDAAKAVSSGISIIVETVTLDYDMATLLGLDGSMLKTAPDVIQAWEVDAVSDETAMRGARPDDWISLIGMSKFAKAASGQKPSWMFTYGKEPDDGLLVMAEALAAGNHPYETKIPQMTTTVGAPYRKRMFSWIKQQELRLFASSSAARAAVYFSPESRDYLDKAAGTGLYATVKRADQAWWSDAAEDSVYSLTYLAEYRGIIKWLAHNHVPFDIVVRADRDELARYQVVIAPALAAISDGAARTLDRYVAEGGHLIVTGPAPAALDEFGGRRSAPILRSLATSSPPSGSTPVGSAVHVPQLLGKSYLVSGAPAASRAIGELINRYSRSPLETDAGQNVHVELRQRGDETLLHLINPERLWNKNAPERRDIWVGLAIPAGATVTAVELISPETGSGPTSLPFRVDGDRVTFSVPLKGYAMAVVARRAGAAKAAEPADAALFRP